MVTMKKLEPFVQSKCLNIAWQPQAFRTFGPLNLSNSPDVPNLVLKKII